MPDRGRRRAGTVRVRTTVVATLIVSAALVVAAIGLVILLQRSQVANVEAAARLRATDIATLVRGGNLPTSLSDSSSDVALVQVVDDQGRVLSATTNIAGEDRIARFQPAGTHPVARTLRNLPVGGGGEFRVVALGVSSPEGPRVVYAAASLAAVEKIARTVTAGLAAGIPILVTLVAATTWVLVGRALQPVEHIRAEVAEITAHALGRRVPEPASNDEVGRLARTMNEMLDRLQAASERQRRFIADASHELRSPLSSLRTQLEVARRHPKKTDWVSAADDCLYEVDRMEGLTRDLLSLARADANARAPRAGPVDVAQLARDEAGALRARGRVVVVEAGIDDGSTTGDAEQLRRVLRNLLDNAERHARTTVTVSVTSGDGAVELTVDDDGPGIPLEARERVFERFTRLDDARDRGSGGTGLGLAIARAIVAGHGGTIEVADGAGGARLLVRLPLRP